MGGGNPHPAKPLWQNKRLTQKSYLSALNGFGSLDTGVNTALAATAMSSCNRPGAPLPGTA